MIARTRAEKIIGSERTYVGRRHPWATGQRVVIVSVIRREGEGAVITNDTDIGQFRPGDFVEFVPFIREEDGAVRRSWVTSDGNLDEFEPGL